LKNLKKTGFATLAGIGMLAMTAGAAFARTLPRIR